MSIAQAHKIVELDSRVAELERTIADLVLQRQKDAEIVSKLTLRVESMEQRPRVGRPPKDAP